MTYIICLILLILCMALSALSLYLIYQVEDLEDESENAEERAVTHFKKLNEIENILKYSNATKENYCITLEKIERVIFTNTTFKR